MYVCIHVGMYVCMYVFMCVYNYINFLHKYISQNDNAKKHFF